MNSKNYAAIDIGSCAARLLIKKVDISDTGDVAYTKLFFIRYPLRLGDDVFTIGKVSKERLKKIVTMIKAFKHLMKLYDVDEYKACATSAMRDAKNSKEVIEKVLKSTGIKIEIIDGKEEASIIYNNHVEMVKSMADTCAYVDVGGGSTEVTVIKDGEKIKSCSYNIGTIRMLHLPEEESRQILSRMQEELSAISEKLGPVEMVGSGGNINKMYKILSKKKTGGKRITVTGVTELFGKINAMSAEQRMETYDMKPDRAEVIIPAAKIFLAVAEALKSTYIYTPVLGLSDGIIDNMCSVAHSVVEKPSDD